MSKIIGALVAICFALFFAARSGTASGKCSFDSDCGGYGKCSGGTCGHCGFDSDCNVGKCGSGMCGACGFDSDCKGGKCSSGRCSNAQ
jgi:hypothetical protein